MFSLQCDECSTVICWECISDGHCGVDIVPAQFLPLVPCHGVQWVSGGGRGGGEGRGGGTTSTCHGVQCKW